MKVYAAFYTDYNTRMDSSSGGMFSAFATPFEFIYGVEMNADNTSAVFTRKTSDISSLRGSKYIQAKVGDTFKNVKIDLDNGKKVLFCGTACQVNGLILFLQKEYPNLVTIDVICHGVPSPLYWEKYIEGKIVESINFRSKEGGWENYTYGMKLNGSYIPYTENKFMSLYIKDYALRPSCYNCACKQNKKSDITIGDFWGIEKMYPSMTDNKGTSIVLVRTEKGQKLFDSISHTLVWQEVLYEEAVKQNPSEYKSVNMPKDRAAFFEDLHKLNFEEIYEKYCPYHREKKICSILRILKNKLRGLVNG